MVIQLAVKLLSSYQTEPNKKFSNNPVGYNHHSALNYSVYSNK